MKTNNMVKEDGEIQRSEVGSLDVEIWICGSEDVEILRSEDSWCQDMKISGPVDPWMLKYKDSRIQGSMDVDTC